MKAAYIFLIAMLLGVFSCLGVAAYLSFCGHDGSGFGFGALLFGMAAGLTMVLIGVSD